MQVRAVAAEIGTSRVYFESVEVAATAAATDRYGTEAPNGSRDLRDAYEQLKCVLEDLSTDLGAVVLRPDGGPSSVALTFGLAFSGEANAWVVRTSGAASLSATLTWTAPPRRSRRASAQDVPAVPAERVDAVEPISPVATGRAGARRSLRVAPDVTRPATDD